MTGITIALDASQLEAWCAQTPRKLKATLRSAVDKSARYARAQTIPVLAADSGVPAARFRAATPTVRGATAGNLEAVWVIGKSANFIRAAGGGPGTLVRGSGMTGATFRETGGGSAHLALPKAFSLGGKGVFVRKGKGRTSFKPVYAESPVSAMRQPNSAPRKAWMAAAEIAVPLLVVGAVQAAFDGANEAPTVAKLAGSTS